MIDVEELRVICEAATGAAEARYRPTASEWDETGMLFPASEREYRLPGHRAPAAARRFRTKPHACINRARAVRPQ